MPTHTHKPPHHLRWKNWSSVFPTLIRAWKPLFLHAASRIRYEDEESSYLAVNNRLLTDNIDCRMLCVRTNMYMRVNDRYKRKHTHYNTRTHTHTHTRTDAQSHTDSEIYTHAHTQTPRRTDAYTPTHTYTHAHTRIHTYTLIHAHTRTHAHIHTHRDQ